MPRRNITFNFPSNSDDEMQDETQNITSIRNTSFNVSSPTRTISNTTQNITISLYDPPSLPSTFKYPNKKQFDQKIIITSKLLVNIMTHSITPFIHNKYFINVSASKPESMKPFDGLDHSYTSEEYLQQVEARLTFAIGEEPLNNPVKYRSWHNRRMTYIQ